MAFNNTPVLFKSKYNDMQQQLKEILIAVVLSINDIDVNIKEEMIKKINHDKYLDLIIIDGNNLTKEQLIDFMNSLDGIFLEPIKIKFFMFYNLDKTSKIIQNSILKFLENLKAHIYGFFSCCETNNILPTILSRLIIKNIDSHQSNYCSKNKQWSKYDKKLIDYFKTDQFVQEFFNSDNQKKILYFIDSFHSSNEFKKLWDDFKSFSYKEIDLVLSLLEDENDFKLTKTIYELKEDINLNLNKTLIFMKLISNRKE